MLFDPIPPLHLVLPIVDYSLLHHLLEYYHSTGIVKNWADGEDGREERMRMCIEECQGSEERCSDGLLIECMRWT